MKSLLLLVPALLTARFIYAELPPLIPRDTLFGNPERTSPALSPDGARLAWLAPDTNNVLPVWVKTVGRDDDKIVRADKVGGMRRYFGVTHDRGRHSDGCRAVDGAESRT